MENIQAILKKGRIPVRMDDDSVRIFTGSIKQVCYVSENKNVNIYMVGYMIGLKIQAEGFNGWIWNIHIFVKC